LAEIRRKKAAELAAILPAPKPRVPAHPAQDRIRSLITPVTARAGPKDTLLDLKDNLAAMPGLTRSDIRSPGRGLDGDLACRRSGRGGGSCRSGGDVRGGIADVEGHASSPVEGSCDPGRQGSCVPLLSGALPGGGFRFGSVSTGRAGRQVQEARCDAFLTHHFLHSYCSRPGKVI
jgi:hypothetical protein